MSGRSIGTRVPFLAWAVTTIVALSHAWLRGRRFPYSDDWDTTVPVLLGRRAVTASWVWSQQNEHRLPVLRVGQLASVWLLRGDFRAPILLSVILASAAALVLLRLVPAWRGNASVADAAIPLALLRLGNSAFGWGGQVHFIASTMLAIFVLRDGAGVALLLLPLCGANGLVLAVPFALVFGGRALARREQGWQRALGFSVATCALAGVYFVGWHQSPRAWAEPSLATTLSTSLRYLGAAGNPSFAGLWPVDGLLVALWSLLVLGALVRLRATLWAWRALLFVALQLGLALVIGRARGGRGWLPDLGYNYASLALGLLVGLAVATLLVVRRPVLLAALLAFVGLPYCVTSVLAFTSPEVRARVDEARALERELASGQSPSMLVARHRELLQPSREAEGNGTVGDQLLTRVR